MITNDKMKSMYGRIAARQEGMALPEAVDLPAIAEGTKKAKEDVRILQQLEKDWPRISSTIDDVVRTIDAVSLVSVAGELKPYFIVAGDYEDEITLERKALEGLLGIVKAARIRSNGAANALSKKLYERFVCKRRAIDEIAVRKNENDAAEDIAKLETLRKEINDVSAAYAELRNNFTAMALQPDIGSYLVKMPKIMAVKDELDAIDLMLGQDQSKNDFADLKQKRRDVDGIFFAGRLRKAVCSLDYKEGLSRCVLLKLQIDQYIKECPQVIRTIDYLDDEKAAIEGVVGLLGAVSAPDMGSASVFETAQKLLFPKDKATSQKYSFLLSKFSRNTDLRKQAGALYERKSGEIYEKANSFINSVKELPEPQGIGELNSAITELRKAEPRLGLLARLFKAMNKDDDCAECYSRQSMTSAKIANLADLQKQYFVVEQEISSLNAMKKEAESLFSDSSLLDYDLKRAVGIMKYQLPDLLDIHLIRNARSECVSLCEDVKKKAHEKLVRGLSQLVSHYSAPLQQTGSLDADETAINSRLLTIRNMVIPFIKNGFSEIAQMKAEEYSQTLEKAAHSLNATLGAFRELRKQRKEYEQKIGEMKLALDKTDSSEIGRLANMPIVDQVSNPYVSGLAKDYNRLVWHLRRAQSGISSEPQASGYENAVVKEQPSDGSFNFFEYVDCRMPAPASPVLKGLKKQLLSGTVASRLSTLEGVIGKAADTPLKAEDLEWLSQLKDAYEKDLSEGYFSQHSNGESREQLSRIMGMMRDYFKK